MVDTLLFEIAIPMLYKLWSQIICFVNDQDKLFFSFTLSDVFLEIFRIEKIRISGVDDLKENVGLLNNSPKLFPDLDILLERRDGQLDIVLLDHCKISPPLEESHILILLDLMGLHFLGPLWSPWDLEWPVFGILDALLVQELVHHTCLVI